MLTTLNTPVPPALPIVMIALFAVTNDIVTNIQVTFLFGILAFFFDNLIPKFHLFAITTFTSVIGINILKQIYNSILFTIVFGAIILLVVWFYEPLKGFTMPNYTTDIHIPLTATESKEYSI